MSGLCYTTFARAQRLASLEVVDILADVSLWRASRGLPVRKRY